MWAALDEFPKHGTEQDSDANSDAVGRAFACLLGCGYRWVVHLHAALTREDEVGSLDDARARGLLFVLVLGGVGLQLADEPHSAAPSQSPAAGSRGLRWPRRDVSGYWQRMCLFAHWLESVRVCSILENQSFSRIKARRGARRGEMPADAVVKG